MKVVIKSFITFAVVAALAVPFVQNVVQNGVLDTYRSGTQSGGPRAQQQTNQNHLGQQHLPAIFAPLSSQTQTVPDFADIYDVQARKHEFFSYLLPAIEETNARIAQQRDSLLTLAQRHADGEPLSEAERNWLARLGKYYRVDETDLGTQFRALVTRVDIVPATVVLIQAANESGWGTSRFAAEGLNFFGQWCWTPGCGMVPAARPQGQVYEVRSFDSMEASVMEFVRNINTHFAYEELRAMRLDERRSDDRVSSATITAGLMSYSERGQDYIDELNQMIRINRPIIEAVQIANVSS